MFWFRILLSSILLSTPALSKETIRLTNGEWPPYLSENLAHHGYASHIVTEAFATVGVDVEYGFFPWKRSYQYAKDGISGSGEIWHGSVVWVFNAERAESFMYTDVVMTDYQVLFHLRSNPLDWTTIDDLQGKTIGGTLHTFYPQLELAAESGVVQLERARDYQTLFTRLLAGRIDAVPHTWSVGRYFLKNHLTAEQREKITFSPTVMQTKPCHIILSNQIPQNEKFKALFNQGLKNIKANGTYQRLQENLENGVYDLPLP
ncbi:transporter substrate-binding domain-containing protein [Vibrio sp. JC009]|uniref:substrate-binding periplasmic protein n=1 Tax=Vibrio sp. JC009 TaxID=2912314 RepID=UPI0023AFE7ED|nr:transporter substrate-binding domain-containing protein [Vibrio sp. JC009]WED22579.1 transporter substrate-binding domain-containing protein [Vibrio sp. JC009]